MARKRKPKMEFRYYKMPMGNAFLALLGKKWIQEYGNASDCLHFHNYLEIGYCHAGKGSLILGEEEKHFSGGEFTVIPANFPHVTNSVPGTLGYWEYLFVDVEQVAKKIYSNNPKRAERIIQRVNSGAFMKKEEENPEITSKIKEILEIMRAEEEFYLEEAQGILDALILNIARMNQDPLETMAAEEEKTVQVIAGVIDYIGANYMEQIRMEELAERCHFSETHFRRVFSAQMNMTPLEYLNMVRVQASCEYLKATDKSMTEIAELCGFASISTFNRNFSRIMGESPRQWRKRPENYEQKLLRCTIHSEEGW